MKKVFSLMISLIMIFTVIASVPFTVSANTDVAEDIIITVDSEIGSETTDISFKVTEKGEYNISFKYKALQNKTTPMQIDVALDGKLLTDEHSGIMLPRFWTTKTDFRVDGLGNQFTPEQLMVEDTNNYTLINTSNYKVEEYILNLSSGSHKFSLSCLNKESFYLESITLTSATKETAFELTDKNVYSGNPITYQGESASLKNNYWLTSASDGSSALVVPYDPVKTKINYVGGSNWSQAGDTIYWKVEAPEEGWYKLSFSYRQGYVLNGKVYRWLRVNGETQYTEARKIGFPYSSDWANIDFNADNGDELCVYLKKGTNELSLTATLGEYTEICDYLEDLISEIGDIYLSITMITGETVDIYRDYRLYEQIPDFNKKLKAVYDKLNEVDKMLLKMSDEDVGSYATSVRNMAQVVKLMIDNPYSAHRYKTTYDSNYSALSSCLNEMQSSPLDIDTITLSAPEKEIEDDKSGVSVFFKELKFSFLRFIASFTEDYNNISGNSDSDKKVTVWVNWGRDQAQILNMLVQTSFAVQHKDIAVDIKISNASVVQGVMSGNGPDVILQHNRTEPVNLAMRGALHDLSQFEDLDEVLERFTENAADPYIYKDGIYALPDTQSFFMMFYRTDVFEQLGLEVPRTWDEYKEVTRILARENLNTWLPYTQLTSMTIANLGVGNLNIFPTLLMQNGLSLYNDELTKTTLTDNESIAVFNDWVTYYTNMKMPYQMDFYNRFRNGTTPIGIAPYTLYSQIKSAAKEIDGKWDMVAVPGVLQEDGTINNITSGSGTGCAILKGCSDPDAAWQFLKWWTSAETQLSYSNNLEAVLGTVGRIAVSNKEAFASLSWDAEMYDDIYTAFNNITEVREIPGSYYISRSIDFAFWNVVTMNETPKDMLITWGEEADLEIKRKMVQYENR